MKERIESKWNADAEASLMGFVITITGDDHLLHIVDYVLNVFKNCGSLIDTNAKEIFAEVNRYNSEEVAVSHFCISSTDFGVLMTFVRDDELKDYSLNSLVTDMGVLAYVYNVDCPECSELGYVFFDNVKGKIKRVA